MGIKREEIPAKDKWNVESIFKNNEEFEKEYNNLKKDIYRVLNFKNKLNESPDLLKQAIETYINLDRRISKLYVYAHMKHDEDTKNDLYKDYHNKALNLSIEFEEITSWINPEILSIEDNKINQFLNSTELKDYKFYLEKILRAKPHILSEKEEKILALASNAISSISDTFRSLNDADLKFGKIIDRNNNEFELTHGKYYQLLINKDREIREQAFKQYHNKFNEFQTTFASLLYGEIKSHCFYAKTRNFNSSLEASLFYKNIDTKVYTNLIDTVKENIKSLHNYLEYRKYKMGLKELHLYDIHVPFIEIPEIKYSYEEAKNILLESIKVLGEEYYTVLKKGLEHDKWVDIYENENKRSGAYSTGSYDTYPFILMNYNGTLNDARTLAHEAGHSMHSYFTHKYQLPQYGNYPIFLAEVASTFNEELFSHYLINTTNDKKKIAYLLNSRLDEIRATFFRQTMFAEFELLIHKLVEQDIPLNHQMLKKEYRKLNEFYFGNNVVIDPEIDIEWARIPHFYYNYYVYQYATGISAAISLFKKVINGGEIEKEKYLNFLKAGNSKYPLDILKDAGVDMTQKEPIIDTIKYFDQILEELKNIDD